MNQIKYKYVIIARHAQNQPDIIVNEFICVPKFLVKKNL